MFSTELFPRTPFCVLVVFFAAKQKPIESLTDCRRIGGKGSVLYRAERLTWAQVVSATNSIAPHQESLMNSDRFHLQARHSLTAAFLFSVFFLVFPFFISNFSFSIMCASLQEFALFRCNGHTDWAECFIQLSSSSQQGNKCYCLTIAFVMIMNVAQFNSSVSI